MQDHCSVCTTSTDDEVDSIQLVPACIWGFTGFAGCLSLKDLCILSATRKDWQEPVAALYSSTGAQQLVKALRAGVHKLRIATTANNSTRRVLHQLWTVVSSLQKAGRWGPALAATSGVFADCTQLFRIPDMPRSLAKAFVQQVGVRISYQQLSAAAYNRVAGVEVWVQVQHELGIETDIPDVAGYICLGDCSAPCMVEWQAKPLDEDGNLLRVLLNCNPTAWIVQSARLLLQHVDDPTTLQHLLETAIIRRHQVIKAAVEHSVVQQLSSAAVLQLMQVDVAVCEPHGNSFKDSESDPEESFRISGSTMWALCHLPAAAEAVTLQDLKLMLQTALSRACDSAVDSLCNLRAAQELSMTDCVDMLKQAFQKGLEISTLTLCSLPAVGDISVEVWVQLFRSVVGSTRLCRWVIGMQGFCKLPAARQASPADIEELLISAIHRRNYTATAALCFLKVPAIEGIARAQLLALWHELISHSDEVLSYHRCAEKSYNTSDYLKSLMGFGDLEVLQQMSTADLLELLDVMKQHRKAADTYTAWVRGIPAAKNIPTDVMTQYLQQAVQMQDPDWMYLLCSMPATAHIDAESLLQMIRDVMAVAQYSNCRVIEELLRNLLVESSVGKQPDEESAADDDHRQPVRLVHQRSTGFTV